MNKILISLVLNIFFIPTLYSFSLETKGSYYYKEIECMAKNLYFEGRGETIEGKVAIMQVVKNRSNDKKFPDSICGVIYQGKKKYNPSTSKSEYIRDKCQFSWLCDGKSDIPKDINSYTSLVVLAYRFLENEHIFTDITKGSVFYHSIHIAKPYWTVNLICIKKIGNHLFYTRDMDANKPLNSNC